MDAAAACQQPLRSVEAGRQGVGGGVASATDSDLSRRQRADRLASSTWVQKLHSLEMEAGTVVELEGLSVAELNGQTGVIVGRKRDKGRYRVRLNATSNEVAVRPKNLVRAAAEWASTLPAEPPSETSSSGADMTHCYHTDCYPRCRANERRLHPWVDFIFGDDQDVEQMPWKECAEMLQGRLLQAMQQQQAMPSEDRDHAGVSEIEEAQLDLHEAIQAMVRMQDGGADPDAVQREWAERTGQGMYTGTMKVVQAIGERRCLKPRLLAEAGCDLDAIAESGDVASLKAAFVQHPHLTPLTCMGDGWGSTLMHWAVEHGHAELLEFLLSLKGADTRVRDNSGDTVLLCAVREGSVECVRVLLEGEHSHPDEGTRTGWCDRWYTGLHLALSSRTLEKIEASRSLEIIELLCKAGATVDCPSRRGDVPLLLAIKNEVEPAVRFLMRRGRSAFNFGRVNTPDDGTPAFKSWTYLLDRTPENGRVCTSFTLRQLVLPAVVAQELRAPGSVDEENLLGLRPRSKQAWYGPGSLSGWSEEQRNSDPDPARSNYSNTSALPTCCLHCGMENAKHVCSGCKSVRFCGRECQKGAHKQHKLDCAGLAANRLPSAVRVVRFADGAIIANPDAMVPSEHCYEAYMARHKQAIKAFLVGAWLSEPEDCAVGLLATQPQLLQMVIAQVAPPLSEGCRLFCDHALHASLPAGTTVTVEAVVSKPELNGQTGVVVSVDTKKRRYAVRLQGLDHTITQVKLKPENCRVRCPCANNNVPCGSACADVCLGRARVPRQHTSPLEPGWKEEQRTINASRNRLNTIPDESVRGIFRGISDCAAAHRSIVLSLSPEQRSACYPLACFERFGHNKWTKECATDDCVKDGISMHSASRCAFRGNTLNYLPCNAM